MITVVLDRQTLSSPIVIVLPQEVLPKIGDPIIYQDRIYKVIDVFETRGKLSGKAKMTVLVEDLDRR